MILMPENKSTTGTQVISERKGICNCPQCGTPGHSIASIYLRENSLQECTGSIRLAGGGLGAGGIGLGAGYGAIDLNGETHTRRAMIFRMPERPEKESQESDMTVILVMLAVMGIGFQLMKHMVDTELTRMPLTIFPILLMLSLLPAVIRIFFYNDREQDVIECRYRIALGKYKKQMELYNSVRYCEQCNVMYENSRNICTMVSSDSFEEIMRKVQ